MRYVFCTAAETYHQRQGPTNPVLLHRTYGEGTRNLDQLFHRMGERKDVYSGGM